MPGSAGSNGTNGVDSDFLRNKRFVPIPFGGPGLTYAASHEPLSADNVVLGLYNKNVSNSSSGLTQAPGFSNLGRDSDLSTSAADNTGGGDIAQVYSEEVVPSVKQKTTRFGMPPAPAHPQIADKTALKRSKSESAVYRSKNFSSRHIEAGHSTPGSRASLPSLRQAYTTPQPKTLI